MIKIERVSKVFGEETLFKNINLNLHENDKVAIVGDNGVGKSTLMQILLDDNHATSGHILYDNKSIGFLSQNVISDFENTVDQEYKVMFKELTNLENKLNELMLAINKNPEDKKILEEIFKDFKFIRK